jgi:hypothetical protein
VANRYDMKKVIWDFAENAGLRPDGSATLTTDKTPDRYCKAISIQDLLQLNREPISNRLT